MTVTKNRNSKQTFIDIMIINNNNNNKFSDRYKLQMMPYDINQLVNTR